VDQELVSKNAVNPWGLGSNHCTQDDAKECIKELLELHRSLGITSIDTKRKGTREMGLKRAA